MSTYFIQDTRQYVGNCVLWWAKDGAGYTTHLDEAWEVEEAKAREIESNRSTDKAIPAKLARASASIQVDMQRLARETAREG